LTIFFKKASIIDMVPNFHNSWTSVGQYMTLHERKFERGTTKSSQREKI